MNILLFLMFLFLPKSDLSRKPECKKFIFIFNLKYISEVMIIMRLADVTQTVILNA